MQVTHTHTDTQRHIHTHVRTVGRTDACYVNAFKTLEFSCAWLNIKYFPITLFRSNSQTGQVERHEGVAGLASLATDQKAEHSPGLVNSAALRKDR